MKSKNNKELVSIIIPAYNVEPYINKCVDSVLMQSYHNIEIIIIDDGSTDNTYKKLEIYSKIDNVTIIHKQNEGVSIARNTGLEKSKGNYVVFLDGDDYLASDFIDYMVNLCKKYDSEFAMSSNCFTHDNQKQFDENIKVMLPIEAAQMLLSPDVIVGCWNKIFKKSLIDKNKLKFDSSLFYGEGLEFILKAAQLSNKVVVGKRAVYYYRLNNQQSATTLFNIDKCYNGEKSLLKIKKSFVTTDKSLMKSWNTHYYLFCYNSFIGVSMNYNVKYKEYRSKLHIFLFKNYIKFLFTAGIKIKTKIKILIALFFPKVVGIRTNKKRMKELKESV